MTEESGRRHINFFAGRSPSCISISCTSISSSPIAAAD